MLHLPLARHLLERFSAPCRGSWDICSVYYCCLVSDNNRFGSVYIPEVWAELLQVAMKFCHNETKKTFRSPVRDGVDNHVLIHMGTRKTTGLCPRAYPPSAGVSLCFESSSLIRFFWVLYLLGVVWMWKHYGVNVIFPVCFSCDSLETCLWTFLTHEVRKYFRWISSFSPDWQLSLQQGLVKISTISHTHMSNPLPPTPLILPL